MGNLNRKVMYVFTPSFAEVSCWVKGHGLLTVQQSNKEVQRDFSPKEM